MSELVTWNTLESLCSLHQAKGVTVISRFTDEGDIRNTIAIDMAQGKIAIARDNKIIWRGLVNNFDSEQAKEALKAIHETQPSFE